MMLLFELLFQKLHLSIEDFVTNEENKLMIKTQKNTCCTQFHVFLPPVGSWKPIKCDNDYLSVSYLEPIELALGLYENNRDRR